MNVQSDERERRQRDVGKKHSPKYVALSEFSENYLSLQFLVQLN